MSDKNDWYLLELFNAGEIYYEDLLSSPTFIVDTISRDGMLYFSENGYLITPEVLKILQHNNLVGVSINEPELKFSMQHNMKHPNQKMPTWYRVIPFSLPENGEMREMYLDENKNLIISSRIKDVFDKAINEKKIRMRRAKFHPYTNKKQNQIIEDAKENTVFKENKESPMKGIIIFIIVMALIAYWFFK